LGDPYQFANSRRQIPSITVYASPSTRPHLPSTTLYDTRTPCPFSAPMANQPLHHEFGSALKAEPAPTGGGTHGGLEETKRFPRCVARTFRAKQKSPSWCKEF
jgi:hypothetical protein